MQSRRYVVTVAVLSVLFAWASSAHAHVTVWPQTVQAETFERFTVRVPSEKDIPTTQIKVEVPDGFAVSRVLPLPGWSYVLEYGPNDAVSAVTWSGGEIGPTEFQEFGLSGRTAAVAGRYVWRAWQTYSDGSVVEWIGPSDAEHPAAFVAVNDPAAPGRAAGALSAAAAYGGLIVGLLALVISLRRR